MKRSFFLICMLSLAVAAPAQTGQGGTSVGTFTAPAPAPVKFVIRHADPYFVKAMLEGMQVNTPEVGPRAGLGGMVAGAAAQGASFVRNGRLVVNPTDNSLWFFPDRTRG